MTYLASNTVSIWHANLETTPVEQAYLITLLSKQEKQRAHRFCNPIMRERFMVARGFLRCLLSSFTGKSAQTLQFGYTQYGKPYLIDEPEIYFNLSHARNKAVYAFAWNTAVGVDIEYQNSISKIERIARRYFSPKEYCSLQNLPENLRKSAFFTIWTQKEAILKALGLNLFFLSNIEVQVEGNTPCLIAVRGISFDCAEWSLHAISPPAGYSVALAVHASYPTIKIHLEALPIFYS